jgi:hypothetical protein
MNQEAPAQVRPQATLPCPQGRRWTGIVPGKVWILLLLFFVAAVLMGVHTILTAKDSSLRLKLQHGFRSAQVSVWIDRELVYSGKVSGSVKKRFGLIPTDSVQGSLSEIIPVRSGQHKVRVRIEPDDATMQEDAINGTFSANKESELSVSARQSALLLSWIGTGSAPAEGSSSWGWLSRYAGSLLLTIAGSIMSALTGYAIRELPGRLRSTSTPAHRANLGPQ